MPMEASNMHFCESKERQGLVSRSVFAFLSHQYRRLVCWWLQKISVYGMRVCVGVYEHVRTPELVPGIEHSHVSRDGVKAAASYDVHSLLSCLAVVVQLHAL